MAHEPTLDRVFRLMRKASETPDKVSSAIAAFVADQGRRPGQRHLLVGSASTFFMNFWNMKQRGEVSDEETAAVWAVTMRAIDASEVVRIVLRHCLGEWTSTISRPDLVWIVNKMLQASNGQLKPHYVSKTREKLITHLRKATRRGQFSSVLSPADADLLLRACETVLQVEKEEAVRWAHP